MKNVCAPKALKTLSMITLVCFVANSSFWGVPMAWAEGLIPGADKSNQPQGSAKTPDAILGSADEWDTVSAEKAPKPQNVVTVLYASGRIKTKNDLDTRTLTTYVDDAVNGVSKVQQFNTDGTLAKQTTYNNRRIESSKIDIYDVTEEAYKTHKGDAKVVSSKKISKATDNNGYTTNTITTTLSDWVVIGNYLYCLSSNYEQTMSTGYPGQAPNYVTVDRRTSTSKYDNGGKLLYTTGKKTIDAKLNGISTYYVEESGTQYNYGIGSSRIFVNIYEKTETYPQSLVVKKVSSEDIWITTPNASKYGGEITYKRSTYTSDGITKIGQTEGYDTVLAKSKVVDTDFWSSVANSSASAKKDQSDYDPKTGTLLQTTFANGDIKKYDAAGKVTEFYESSTGNTTTYHPGTDKVNILSLASGVVKTYDLAGTLVRQDEKSGDYVKYDKGLKTFYFQASTGNKTYYSSTTADLILQVVYGDGHKALYDAAGKPYREEFTNGDYKLLNANGKVTFLYEAKTGKKTEYDATTLLVKTVTLANGNIERYTSGVLWRTEYADGSWKEVDASGKVTRSMDKDGYDQDGFGRDGFHKTSGLDHEGYNRAGYSAVTGLDREGYAKDGFNVKGLDRESYGRDGFHSVSGYNRKGYDKTGYDKEGFDKNLYGKDGFHKISGLDKESYAKDGFHSITGYNREGYDKAGYDKTGLDKEGYAKDGFNVKGLDRESYGRDGFHSVSGYNRKGYDKTGYDMEGFDKNLYGKDGFHKTTGVDIEGYDRAGFHSVTGYNRDGYDKDGFKDDGYDAEGYNKSGYGKDGFHKMTGLDKEGYAKDGFHSITGYSREGYDKAGYNKVGLDREGYDKTGFNVKGLDRESYGRDGFHSVTGYNRKGYDKTGYDIEGFDINLYGRDGFHKTSGLDKDGYAKDGFHSITGYSREGYDKAGYNKVGLDREGYDKTGFNVKGLDRESYGRDGFHSVTGYNRKGYDRTGYDIEGFDKDLYGKDGFHKTSGLDKTGYDRQGYDALGNDHEGYNRDGFNAAGKNRAGDIRVLRADGTVLTYFDNSTKILNEYSNQNVVIRTAYPDGHTLFYDDKHKLTSEKMPDGTLRSYDAQELIYREDYIDKSFKLFDADGNITLIQTARLSMAYDAVNVVDHVGRLTKLTDLTTGESKTYTYDGDTQNVQSILTRASSGLLLSKTYFDAAGSHDFIYYEDGVTLKTQRNSDGSYTEYADTKQIVSVRFAESDSEGAMGYEYDSKQRKTKTVYKDGSYIITSYKDDSTLPATALNTETFLDKDGKQLRTLVYNSKGTQVRRMVTEDNRNLDCFFDACWKEDMGFDTSWSSMVPGSKVAVIETGAASTDHAMAVAGILRRVTGQGSDVTVFTAPDHIKVIDAMKQAALAGFKVINLSLEFLRGDIAKWGAALGYDADRAVKEFKALLQEGVNFARNLGVTIVASAGNQGQDFSALAELDGVVSVGSTDFMGRRVDSSGFGQGLDFMASGWKVYSEGQLWTGTSFAAPMISGMMAGMFMMNGGGHSETQILNAMKSSATDLGSSGWDKYFGYGKANAARAMRGLMTNLYQMFVD